MKKWVSEIYNYQCKMCKKCFVTNFLLVDFCDDCEDEVLDLIDNF